MFYSTDILTRRRNGFGIFWLAATLGSKGGSSFKKLTRKELLECNLVLACKHLAEPEEPLALRLSSNLLCGIARVFQQQYSIHQAEVTLCHTTLKKNLAEIYQKGNPASSIDLPANAQGQAGAAINLVVDPLLAQFGWDADFDLGIDWAAIGLLRPGPVKIEELHHGGEGIGSGFDMESSILKHPTGKHVVRDMASITLQEPYFEDSLLQEDDMYVANDPLDFGDGEGLLMGHSQELDAMLQEAYDTSTRGSGEGSHLGRWRAGGGGASSSAAGNDYFMGGLDDDLRIGEQEVDVWAGHEFGGGDEERVGKEHQDGMNAQNASGQRLLEDLDLEWDENADGVVVEGSFGKRKVLDAEIEDGDAAPIRAAKRNKKTLQFDMITTLSHEYLQQMRLEYPARIRVERERIKRVKEAKEAAQRAHDGVFGVPDHFGGGLANFWQVYVSNRLARFDTKGRTHPEQARRLKAGKPADETVTEAGVSGPNVQQDFFDVFGDMGGGDDLYREQGRTGRLDEQDMGGMQMEDFVFEDVEQGRGGSANRLTGSQRNSLMPWNVGFGMSDGVAGGDFGGFSSSQPGTARVSLALSAGGIHRSRTGSLVPSFLDSGTPGAGSLAPDAENFVEDEKMNNDSTSLIHDPEMEMATLERESVNFLAFMRRQAEAEPNDLFFTDILPIASTEDAAAAQGLYHVLVLASKGLIKVTQDEAYGEITMEVVGTGL